MSTFRPPRGKRGRPTGRPLVNPFYSADLHRRREQFVVRGKRVPVAADVGISAEGDLPGRLVVAGDRVGEREAGRLAGLLDIRMGGRAEPDRGYREPRRERDQ